MQCPIALQSNRIWVNRETPPVLDNPDCYKISDLQPATWPAFGIVCSGMVYAIFEPDNTKDIYIDLEGQMLPYGIIVNGGRNAILTNGGFDLEVQPGCDVGQLPNLPLPNHPNSNIHPRMPAGGAIIMAQWGTTWIEGIHGLANGIEMDWIISRNGWHPTTSQTAAQALQSHDFHIINSRFEGWENQGATANPNIGDGIHGDLFQNQGTSDPLRLLSVENVTGLTSGEGITNSSFPPTGEVRINNYYYDYSAPYIADDYLDGTQQGVALATNSPNIDITAMKYRNGAGGPLAIQDNSGVNGPAGSIYYVDPADANGTNLLALQGLERIPGSATSGEPSPVAACDAAPAALVGPAYQSPFGYSYCQ